MSALLRRTVSPLARAATRAASTAALQPFHIAVPVHSLDTCVLKCEEGRSSKTWIDWNLYGHQLVTHFASPTYRGTDYFNGVDMDMVPVPHFGVCLTVPQFHALAKQMKDAGTRFIVEPHLRFEGKPGEQWTMFFKDPSNNSLEFKAMTNPDNLFAKYYVE